MLRQRPRKIGAGKCRAPPRCLEIRRVPCVQALSDFRLHRRVTFLTEGLNSLGASSIPGLLTETANDCIMGPHRRAARLVLIVSLVAAPPLPFACHLGPRS